MKTICIYHSRDLDGWTSAAIVKKREPEVKLYPWDYGDPLPRAVNEDGFLLFGDGESDIIIQTEKDKDVVIMVDISFSMEYMQKLALTNLITWIDHHGSAIKEYETCLASNNVGPLYNAIYDTKEAACELTWGAFFPKEPMPEAVRLLGRYDCFEHKGTDEEKRVLMFQYGARTVASNPDDAASFLNHDLVLQMIINDGEAVYRHLCMEARQAYDNGFEVRMDGKVVWVIPKERINPVNFGIDYHKDGYDIAACFWYKNHKWHWSLYNDDKLTDVSIIAVKRAGGGHKGAAGFVSDKLEIWDK